MTSIGNINGLRNNPEVISGSIKLPDTSYCRHIDWIHDYLQRMTPWAPHWVPLTAEEYAELDEGLCRQYQISSALNGMAWSAGEKSWVRARISKHRCPVSPMLEYEAQRVMDKIDSFLTVCAPTQPDSIHLLGDDWVVLSYWLQQLSGQTLSLMNNRYRGVAIRLASRDRDVTNVLRDLLIKIDNRADSDKPVLFLSGPGWHYYNQIMRQVRGPDGALPAAPWCGTYILPMRDRKAE